MAAGDFKHGPVATLRNHSCLTPHMLLRLTSSATHCRKHKAIRSQRTFPEIRFYIHPVATTKERFQTPLRGNGYETTAVQTTVAERQPFGSELHDQPNHIPPISAAYLA